jgi:hypothetical protein
LLKEGRDPEGGGTHHIVGHDAALALGVLLLPQHPGHALDLVGHQSNLKAGQLVLRVIVKAKLARRLGDDFRLAEVGGGDGEEVFQVAWCSEVGVADLLGRVAVAVGTAAGERVDDRVVHARQRTAVAKAVRAAEAKVGEGARSVSGGFRVNRGRDEHRMY